MCVVKVCDATPSLDGKPHLIKVQLCWTSVTDNHGRAGFEACVSQGVRSATTFYHLPVQWRLVF